MRKLLVGFAGMVVALVLFASPASAVPAGPSINIPINHPDLSGFFSVGLSQPPVNGQLVLHPKLPNLGMSLPTTIFQLPPNPLANFVFACCQPA
jgi:hypothetical protein